MRCHIGLENNTEGGSLAWVLNLPGCTASVVNGNQALAHVPGSVASFAQWAKIHRGQDVFDPGVVEVVHDETWEVYDVDENFNRIQHGESINAWFLWDWKPLTAKEIELGLQMLSWARTDLLASVRDLTKDMLNHSFPGERWSISGILNHVGGAEWWYLDRLGLAFPREDVPKDPLERPERVRIRLVRILPELVGDERVLGVNGEFWSPRKLLRRSIWHELDHVQHIRKLTQW